MQAKCGHVCFCNSQATAPLLQSYPRPQGLRTNAFSFDWQAESAPYANHSWSLIPQDLSKIVADEVSLMLVVPEWPRAPWFELFRRLVERQFRADGPLYLTDDGKLRPAPRLATVIAVVDGDRY